MTQEPTAAEAAAARRRLRGEHDVKPGLQRRQQEFREAARQLAEAREAGESQLRLKQLERDKDAAERALERQRRVGRGQSAIEER